jgi:1-acyl-sn-glycerol-3-phosphate acyltransferase
MLKFSLKSALYQVPGIAFLISMCRLQIEYDLIRKKTHDEVFGRAHTFAQRLLKLLKVKVEVSGLENLINKPAIICQNHTSIMDIPAILHTVNGKSLFCAKFELFKIWVFGKGIEILGMVKVYKDDKKTWKVLSEAAKKIKETVLKDKALTPYLVIFPEGTRTKDEDYKMGEFKRGMFSIAVKHNLPIIPIASYGGLDITPKGAWIFSKGTIYEKVLEPLYPADYDEVSIKEKSTKLQNDTRKRINKGLGELMKAHGNQKNLIDETAKGNWLTEQWEKSKSKEGAKTEVITCPECGQRLRIPKNVNLSITCPRTKCQTVFDHIGNK